MADERRVEAERQSRIVLSRQLAAQAQAMVARQPKLIARAGLLAIEAAFGNKGEVISCSNTKRGVIVSYPQIGRILATLPGFAALRATSAAQGELEDPGFLTTVLSQNGRFAAFHDRLPGRQERKRGQGKICASNRPHSMTSPTARAGR